MLSGKKRVLEVGCGDGHVAAYLAKRGLRVEGLDLSSEMVAVARAAYPALAFASGNLLALPLADASVDAIVAFYSIVHFHDGQLALAFSEMARVLMPGGLAAFAFHIGDEVIHRDEWWTHPVTLDFRMLPTEHVVELLRDAGMDVTSTTERGPYHPDVEYQSRRAYLVARRP